MTTNCVICYFLTLDHIKNSNGKGRYILSFGLDYLRYGHDNTPREKEAINKFNRDRKSVV